MRLIDAEELKNSYAQMIAKLEAGSDGYIIPLIAEMAISSLMDCIKYQPTIEAKPVVHAHWEEVSGGRTICTNCGNYPLYDYFGRLKLSDCCPSCGAQMDESISCSHEDDKPISQDHENGVKIPVIRMEDVPKLAKEMEK